MPAAILLALLAAAPAAADTPAEAVHIRWVRVASTLEATQACRARFPHWPATAIGGCYFRDGALCTVVAPDPAVRIAANGKRWYEWAQWSALGHEVKHCFDGNFHD